MITNLQFEELGGRGFMTSVVIGDAAEILVYGTAVVLEDIAADAGNGAWLPPVVRTCK